MNASTEVFSYSRPRSEGLIRSLITGERLTWLCEWLFPPRRPMEVSEVLEAHRAAWRRIEIRRQEFAPPDLQVADRIVRGFGKSTKKHHGYEEARARLAWIKRTS